MNRAMESLAPWARVAYGVDVSGISPIVVQARRRGGRLFFETVGMDALSVQTVGDTGAAVACGLAPGLAMATWLRTPLVSATKTVRVLPTLLDMALPFPLEECVYAFSPSVRLTGGAAAAVPLKDGDENTGRVSLAVAVRRRDVENRLSALSAQGIDPHVLDHEGLVLWTQALEEVPPGKTECFRVVVWMRGRTAFLVMGVGACFWSAHRISAVEPGTMERTVRVQLHSVRGGRYAQVPMTWIWGGSLEVCTELRERVEAAFPGTSVTLPEADAFLARGLAARALTRGPLRFNLRSGVFLHPKAERRVQAAIYRNAAAVALLAIGLLALNGVHEYRHVTQARKADARFVAGVTRVAGYPVKAIGENALLIAERELTERVAADRVFVTAFKPSLLEPLNAVLESVVAEEGSIQSLVADFERLGIHGEISSRAAAEALLLRLEPLGYALVLKPGDDVAGTRFEYTMESTAEASQ